jgi:hypothetical protein
MLAPSGAKRAAIRTGAPRFQRRIFRGLGGVALAAGLAGCLATTPPLAGADPASPDAKVAPVIYRSTTAPYTALRPAAPTPWGGRNDDAPAAAGQK